MPALRPPTHGGPTHSLPRNSSRAPPQSPSPRPPDAAAHAIRLATGTCLLCVYDCPWLGAFRDSFFAWHRSSSTSLLTPSAGQRPLSTPSIRYSGSHAAPRRMSYTSSGSGTRFAEPPARRPSASRRLRSRLSSQSQSRSVSATILACPELASPFVKLHRLESQQNLRFTLSSAGNLERDSASRPTPRASSCFPYQGHPRCCLTSPGLA